MFRRLPSPHPSDVTLTVEGRAVTVPAGDSVAAALFAAGLLACRATPVGGAARGPYCMMGVCFDCLVEIDGQANRQGCLVQAADGMVVRRQAGARAAGPGTMHETAP